MLMTEDFKSFLQQGKKGGSELDEVEQP